MKLPVDLEYTCADFIEARSQSVHELDADVRSHLGTRSRTHPHLRAVATTKKGVSTDGRRVVRVHFLGLREVR